MTRRSTAQLRVREQARFVHVLLIQGLDEVWTDDASGTLLGSVITGLTDRTCREGLTVPRSIRMGIDTKRGWYQTRPVSFELSDADGHVAALFGQYPNDDDISTLFEPIHPTDDPIPGSVLVSRGAPAAIDISGKYVGLERIGPTGERNHFSPFNFSLPPLYHAPNQSDSPIVTSIPVSDEPVIFEGRLVALYRFHIDENESGASAYGAFSEADLAWWGVLRDRAEITGDRTWSLSCYGPEGLLKRQLNSTTQTYRLVSGSGSMDDTNWFSVKSNASLSSDKLKIAVMFKTVARNGTKVQFESSAFHVDNDLTAGDSVQDIAAHIASVVSSVSDGTNTGLTHTASGTLDTWNDLTRSASFSIENASIQVSRGENAMGVMQIALHEEVWAMLGWDIAAQANNGPVKTSYYDVEFTSMGDVGHQLHDWYESGAIVEPRAGYVVAEFDTLILGANFISSSNDMLTNHGSSRVYRRIRDSAASHIDVVDGQQWINIGVDRPYMDGQTLGEAPSGATLPGGGTADRSRYWVMRGGFLPPDATEDTEPELVYQVFKGDWKDDGAGHMAEDSNNAAALYIDKWLDPRVFGIPHAPLHERGIRIWHEDAGGHEVVPLTVLTQNKGNGADTRMAVWLQTMMSTGTASWSGTGPSATLTAGVNSVSVAGNVADREHASLGLGIPSQLVADAQDILGAFSEADPRGQWSGPMQQVKIAWIGSKNSEEILDAVTVPTGVANSLHGGKYGLFPLFGTPGPLDVSKDPDGNDLEIGEADLATIKPPTHGRKLDGAYQQVVLDYRLNPIEDETSFKRKDQALDRGAQWRAGNLTYELRDIGIISSSYWGGSAGLQNRIPNAQAWTKDYLDLWGAYIPSFYASRNFVVDDIHVAPVKGQHMWPGTLVRLTNPWPQNPYGGDYGLSNALARVVEVDRRRDGSAVCTMLIYGASLRNGGVFYAPSLRLAGYNSSTRQARYVDQWSGGDRTVDESAGWTKPSWLAGSGNMKVTLMGWNRYKWFIGPTGEVESIDTDSKLVTFASPGLTGYLRDTDYIMVPDDWDDQTADWVTTIYAPIVDVSKLAAGTQTNAKRYVR